MENRERDRVSQRASPTEAGEINRRVEEEKGREHNRGTSAEFGQSIGRSENLEGGNMQNRNDGPMTSTDTSTGREVREDETPRRPIGGGSFGSDKSSGSSQGDNTSDDSRLRKDSSEGRH